VAHRFAVQREQPGPAIGALEPGRARAVEIGAFLRHQFRRQHGIGAGTNVGGFGHLGIEPRQRQHLPPAM